MSRSPVRHVPGVLLVTAERASYAANVHEHIAAIESLRRYPVYRVHSGWGLPASIARSRFDAVILHYSLFGYFPYEGTLDDRWLDYLQAHGGYKIAFFQDEYRLVPERFGFVNELGIDCVYTLVRPEYFADTWHRHTNVARVVHTLPSFVSDEWSQRAAGHARPDAERTLDIGYRGRPVPRIWGRGAREKETLPLEFADRVRGKGLNVDVSCEMHERLYGDKWQAFLGDCRGTLGVEGGATLFDIEGVVHREYSSFRDAHPDADDAEVAAALAPLLEEWDGRIPYLMVTPRNFEAAAARCAQLLFEGAYSGVMAPGRHYIELRKDFSNLDDALAVFLDPEARREVAANAYGDLIGSGRYSYRELVAGLEEVLADAGVQPAAPARDLAVDLTVRRAYWATRWRTDSARRRLQVELRPRAAAARRRLRALMGA